MAKERGTVGFVVRAYLAGRMLIAGGELAGDAFRGWLAAPTGAAGAPMAAMMGSQIWSHAALLVALLLAWLLADALSDRAWPAGRPPEHAGQAPLGLALACLGLWLLLSGFSDAAEASVTAHFMRQEAVARYSIMGWERLAPPLFRLAGGLLVLAAPGPVLRLLAGGPRRGAGAADGGPVDPPFQVEEAPVSASSGGDSPGRRAALAMLLLLGVGLVLAVEVFHSGKFVEMPVAASVDLRAAGQGAGNGQLSSPRGLAVAPYGDVYVADCQNSRIEAFGPDGAFKLAFGGPAAKAGLGKPGEFSEPSGVAVGPDGVVYVADTWNQRVQKFSGDGAYLGEYKGDPYNFYSPRNVAMDTAGNLYVADTGHSQIKVLSPAGKLLLTLGGMGGGQGQFREVFGVAVNSKGEIFAADPGNGRVHKFSPLPAGDPLKDVDVPGWRQAPPFWPQVAINQNDEVFVTDNRAQRIWIYDSELAYRGSIVCGKDPAPGPALGAAFARDGQLWISDMGRGILQRLTGFEPLPVRP